MLTLACAWLTRGALLLIVDRGGCGVVGGLCLPSQLGWV